MKLHTKSNHGLTINYKFSLGVKKWVFQVADNPIQLVHPCNGTDTAHKVANVVLGSFKRSKGLDALARKNIAQITGH